jgi:hypothetical protein
VTQTDGSLQTAYGTSTCGGIQLNTQTFNKASPRYQSNRKNQFRHEFFSSCPSEPATTIAIS